MIDFYPLIFLPNDTNLPCQTLNDLRNSPLDWDEKTEGGNCLGSYLGEAIEQVRARSEVVTARKQATPSSLAKLEKQALLPGKTPTTRTIPKKVELKPEELPEEEKPPPDMVRVEAQKLIDDTYQQLLVNKEWVKQPKVLV